MTLLHFNRYRPIHPRLKQLIKYYWLLKSDSYITIEHKMLPVNNIDFILNFSSSIKYNLNGEFNLAPKYFFSGIQKKHYFIHQIGRLDTLGISFFPAGLYPFLKISLSEFTNKITLIDDVLKKFSLELEEKLYNADSILQRIKILEGYFLQILDPYYSSTNKIETLMNTYYSNIDNIDVEFFCKQHKINQRKLERIFNRHIGVSPKYFQKLTKTQKIVKQILNKNYLNFTSIAYENDYYDQAHFIKEFKSFTGCPPSKFVKDEKSIKQIIKFY